MGFEELPHTADCALRVWAPDLAALFVEAALGLNSLAGAAIGGGPRLTRDVLLHSSDTESLLVSFLAELIYVQEQEHLGFDEFQLLVTNNGVSGKMEGSRLSSLMRPVKAVTFHNLKILSTARGCETEIVFDV